MRRKWLAALWLSQFKPVSQRLSGFVKTTWPGRVTKSCPTGSVWEGWGITCCPEPDFFPSCGLQDGWQDLTFPLRVFQSQRSHLILGVLWRSGREVGWYGMKVERGGSFLWSAKRLPGCIGCSLGRVPAESTLGCMGLHPKFLLRYCALSHFLPGC